MDIINHTHTIQWVGPLSYKGYLEYVRDVETTSSGWFNFYCFQTRRDARYNWHRYFGIHKFDDGIDKRVSASHEKIRNYKDDRDFSIWIGSFSDRCSQTPENVDLIETLFISLYRDVLDLNTRKKKSVPSDSVGVINMWFDDRDYLKQYRVEKPSFLDDVLLYYSEEDVFYKGVLHKKRFSEKDSNL